MIFFEKNVITIILSLLLLCLIEYIFIRSGGIGIAQLNLVLKVVLIQFLVAFFLAMLFLRRNQNHRIYLMFVSIMFLFSISDMFIISIDGLFFLTKNKSVAPHFFNVARIMWKWNYVFTLLFLVSFFLELRFGIAILMTRNKK